MTLESFDRRIENSAADLRRRVPDAKVERGTFYDAAWPRDDEEFRRFSGYGILVVAAITGDSGELPLRAVYIEHADGSKTQLRQIGSAMRTVQPESNTAHTYGPYRQDAIFLIPVGEAHTGSLQCDFVRNRTGFIVARSGLDPPHFDDETRSAMPAPADDVLSYFFEREYPGFAIAISKAEAP